MRQRIRWARRLVVSALVLSSLLGIGTNPARAQMLAPFCGVPVLFWPGHPMGGQATFGPGGQPVILADPNLQVMAGPPFFRFLLAHECAHHVLGQLWELQVLQMQGQFALLEINPQIELAADCWAAETLAARGDGGAIAAAADLFEVTQGPFNYPGYPTGDERASEIRGCGAP